MHTTINSKQFLEIGVDSDVQNLSDTNIYYTESITQPPLTNGYLTDGYLLPPLKIFKFEITSEDDPNLKCWVYNPNFDAVKVQV